MLKIQLCGHLGQDALIKEINGAKVINFSIADSVRYKDKDGNKSERTTWVNCLQWTENTKIVQYMTKGRLIFAEGYPSANTFKNKEGVQMVGLNCRVFNLQLIGKNATPENKANDNSGASNDFPPMNDENEDNLF